MRYLLGLLAIFALSVVLLIQCGEADLCEGVDCNDDNECTEDVCSPVDGSCSHTALADGTACTLNGDLGQCVAGVCTAGCEGVDCDDGNPCTEDGCSAADGTCSHPTAADGTACPFGEYPGQCSAGVCVGLCEGVECNDENQCTEDVCNPADGSCSNTNRPDGARCDFDRLSGVCRSGVCEDAQLCREVDCRDDNDCTEDICDPMDGSCSNPNKIDGAVCKIEDDPGRCTEGRCVGLCEGVVCNDHNQCTSDACDSSDGTCIYTGLTDGTPCDFGSEPGKCMSGTCSYQRAWSPPAFMISTIDSVTDLTVNADGDYAAIELEVPTPDEPGWWYMDRCLWTYPNVRTLACHSNPFADGSFSHLQLGIDADGNATVSWESIDRFSEFTLLASSDAAMGTTQEFPIGFGIPGGSQLAVAANGDALLAWVAYHSSGDTEVRGARFTRAGGWEPEVSFVEALSPKWTTHIVALGPDGDGMVFWNDGLGELWSRRFTTTDRWQAAESVGSESARQFSLALDSEGLATVAYSGWSRRSTRSQAWGEAVSTEARGQLAADELGHVIAVWAQDGQLWSSRFTPIGTWSESEVIGAGDDAHLAVGPQGIAMVVWSTTDGLWWNRFTPSGGWKTAEPIDDTSGAYLPKVAVDADGDAKLVWARSNEIWSSDYR